ncbi:ROK family protein [Lacticaseibacillus hulanensis]|uniref:ROK family protein n=1 Tax=Lacticaseibacillus hulanensis TaxID=2493111 RepID=UPI000FDC4D26|nr:ROK family protein [Lacticaseibacillus hulanensis]
MKAYVAFDIGGTSIKYGVVTADGQIAEHASVATAQDRATNVANLEKVVADYRQQYDIGGIGVSVPGIVDRDGYMITGGALPEFYEFPLGATLRAATHLPVHVENDANAAAIAERWLGAAQGVDDYVCIVLGTGIGGGIVINGKVYRGAHGMAGEFGWNVTHNVDRTVPLEDLSLNFNAATVMGLVRRYNLSLKQARPYLPEITDARVIIDEATKDAQVALPIYSQFLDDVAVMILNTYANYDPELILIGGGISANQQFMIDLQTRLAEFMQRHESLHRIEKRVLGKVAPAKLRNNAGLIGAVYPLI